VQTLERSPASGSRTAEHLYDDIDRGARRQRCRERLHDGAASDKLTGELARVIRPGGASREFVTPTERARTSVQKAIRRALARISEQAPDLADKLDCSIPTGTYWRPWTAAFVTSAVTLPMFWTVAIRLKGDWLAASKD
jgi:hypothetical protein